MYNKVTNEKFKSLKNKKDIYILAIESSCDETSVAVTCGRKVLSCVIASQIELHRRFGGVVPEIASRNHICAIDNITKSALDEAKLSIENIDAIAVTYGAGLLGALLVGVSYAKALSYAKKIPLIAVSHIKGHIASNYIENQNLKPPYLCLLVSGGNTAIIDVKDYNKLELLGATQDDAVGEAFDKVARVLGLSYPGGPEIEKLAKKGCNNIKFPYAFKHEKTLDFSYSGLKTAVINYLNTKKSKGEPINKADVACSFQTVAIDMLIRNVKMAQEKTSYKTVIIAGGVASNESLREEMDKAGKAKGFNVIYPPLKYCTDNAAMIGVGAYVLIKNGAQLADLTLDAKANVQIV